MGGPFLDRPSFGAQFICRGSGPSILPGGLPYSRLATYVSSPYLELPYRANGFYLAAENRLRHGCFWIARLVRRFHSGYYGSVFPSPTYPLAR